jgi:AcrR family transcriptional regulator
MKSPWARLEQAATAGRPGLTVQKIAAAAVAIADTDGLDAISMRRVAAELGVSAMAAYRHVSSKDDVLEIMVDLVYGEVDIPDAAGWRETMSTFAHGVRGLVLKHPWLTWLSAPQVVFELTPRRLALEERALSVLEGLGLDADTAMSVYRSVAAFVHGATRAEIGYRQLIQERGCADGADARLGLSGQLNWLLSTGRYPAFARYVQNAVRQDDLTWQFETGLDYVLDGIAARIE